MPCQGHYMIHDSQDIHMIVHVTHAFTLAASYSQLDLKNKDLIVVTYFLPCLYCFKPKAAAHNFEGSF